MSFILVDQITKSYGNGDSTVTALNTVSFAIQSGEFVSIMGESGAGKSTLLSIMGAMNTPTQGNYFVDDLNVYALSNEQQADFRREYLGFVFQSFHLIPYLTVMENAMLPLTATKIPTLMKKEMAMDALQWVDLENKAKRLPNQISGGECERVAVARAIVNNPAILLADEPTGNLDTRNTEEVMSLLGRLNASGTTVVMVTHSAACAAHARRIIHVTDGRVDNTKSRQPPMAASVKAA